MCRRCATSGRIVWLPCPAFAGALAAALALSCVLGAETLPLRRYTLADGLPSNSVSCVVRDSHDFLWFCTSEGVSRFDGYTFVNYGTEEGLPDRSVTSFAQSASGEYWIGTIRGLVRFDPKPSGHAPMFIPFPLSQGKVPQQVYALTPEKNGGMWVGSLGGIFLLSKGAGGWSSQIVEFPVQPGGTEGPMMEDRAGNLWVVLSGPVLCRRDTHGHIDRFDDPLFFRRGANRIISLFEDRAGRMWVGSYQGLVLLADHPSSGRRLIAHVYTRKDGLLDDVAGGVFQTSDGRLWVAAGGLYEILPASNPAHIRFKLQGRGRMFGAVEAEDAQGNLWMGATRLARHGFITYSHADGLRTEDVRSVFEGHDGRLYVITGTHSRFVHSFDGNGFVSVSPRIPGYNQWRDTFWGWGQIHFVDREGQWWIGTQNGLLRYPRVKRLEDLAHTTPRIYTTYDGLGGNYLFRLFEDSGRNVWISFWGGIGLTRWDRATGRFHALTAQDGWRANTPTAFAEDRSNHVWIGDWEGRVARYADGRIEYFSAGNVPDSAVTSMLLARDGQLWIGTSRGGLLRVHDPDGPAPQFLGYTTREGLSSNNVRALTEDHFGRIYFWTDRGVDRLEPATGIVRHYTTADGLVAPGSDHQVAFCDRHGTLWFGFQGLSRLDPEADLAVPSPPPIRITRLRVRGLVYPISELGESDVSGLVMQPSENQVEIEFASVNFGIGELLRYEYKLNGSGADWSSLSDLRKVNYADLRPGKYRFLVRAVNAEGVRSAVPAALQFQILAPVWQRWWFLAAVAALITGILYQAHRYRVAQLVALERLRTTIASDLHDEIGSGLSQIAILSEVAKRQVPSGPRAAEDVLNRVADVSRELVDSMSEIVWAINPRVDALEGLTQRMRRFASDLLAPRNIEFSFRTPQLDHGPALRADIRRHLFLIFKEALNNAVRHAECSIVEASVAISGSELSLTVADNGQGFNPTTIAFEHGGHGLGSMQRRAEELGGKLRITSADGQGTRIELHIPLKLRRGFGRGSRFLPEQVVTSHHRYEDDAGGSMRPQGRA